LGDLGGGSGRYFIATPLAQLFGCVRVVWNDALAASKASEKYPGYNVLSSALTLVKKTEAREWLKDVSSVPLQQSLKNLGFAEPREDLPSSPTLLPKEKGARIHVPSPFGRGLG